MQEDEVEVQEVKVVKEESKVVAAGGDDDAGGGGRSQVLVWGT